MISSKINEPDRVLLKQRDLILKKHYEKLTQIRNSGPKSNILSKSFVHRNKNSSNTERKIEINRTNKILLSKITHISHRKPEISKSASNIHKSLNIHIRKQATYKINEENEKIASRIRCQRPLILKKKFEDEFLLHQKYKTQLSKQRLMKYKESFWGKSPLTIKKSLTPTMNKEPEENKLKASQRLELIRSYSKSPIFNQSYTSRPKNVEYTGDYEDDFML